MRNILLVQFRSWPHSLPSDVWLCVLDVICCSVSSWNTMFQRPGPIGWFELCVAACWLWFVAAAAGFDSDAGACC